MPAPIQRETYLAFNQLPPEEVVNTHDVDVLPDVDVLSGVYDTDPQTSDPTLSSGDLPVRPDSGSLADRDESFYEGIRKR